MHNEKEESGTQSFVYLVESHNLIVKQLEVLVVFHFVFLIIHTWDNSREMKGWSWEATEREESRPLGKRTL